MHYIHELDGWPHFTWDEAQLATALADVRNRQGRIVGRMESLGFKLRANAILDTLTVDVIKTSEIEGEMLSGDQVRSSVAKRLGMDIAALVNADRHVDGVVDMMIDATQNYQAPLNRERLFAWHSALFPSGRSGLRKIKVGAWRDISSGPMQVVSGPMGREHIHFEAPDAAKLETNMLWFFRWFEDISLTIDPVIRAAVAHLWFVTIHPFEDGNGRIARAIADMALSRSDKTAQRFYSMSAQIRIEQKLYYEMLEKTQKGDLDITAWINWFLACLNRALDLAETSFGSVLAKAHFWEQHADKATNVRQRKMTNQLLDGFEGKLTTSKWAILTKCSQDTALRDIDDLVARGILAKDTAGGRSTAYYLVV